MPTGVSHLDSFLNGGHEPGEVYLLLGAAGTGKSIQLTQLVIEAARQFSELAQEGGESLTVSYFCDDLETKQVIPRILACGASIIMDRLEGPLDAVRDLSSADKLHPYEQELYQAAGILDPDQQLGEQERLDQFNQCLLPHIRLHDFRNLPVLRAASRPGLTSVNQIVQMLQQGIRANFTPGLVLIDSLNDCATRSPMNAGPSSDSTTRDMLREFPRRLARDVAQAFGLPVWCAQTVEESVDFDDFAGNRATDEFDPRTPREGVTMAFGITWRDLELQIASLKRLYNMRATR